MEEADWSRYLNTKYGMREYERLLTSFIMLKRSADRRRTETQQKN